MRGRQKYVLHSFSLNHGFIPLGFPGTLFPSLIFFPIGFFSGKVLMRHILDRHPRGSVMNIINGCPYNNWVIVLYCACYPSHCISL